MTPKSKEGRPRSSRMSSLRESFASDMVVAFGGTKDEEEEKAGWTNNTAFLFAAIGAAIGLGNVIRFPFLAYRHGGAAFLIPYGLAWLLVGIPLLGMEYMVGQRMRQSGAPATFALVHARSWGIGVVACYTSFLILITYNMVMAYCWVYFFYSFCTVLPWGTDLESSQEFFNAAVQGSGLNNYTSCGIVPGGDGSCGIGSIKWELIVGLIVQNTLLFLALSKGKKLVSKVVMITMPLPVILMVIMFIYALTLEGKNLGIEVYIGKLDSSQLQQGDTWVDAVGQIFYGLGVATGGMLAYGAAQPLSAKVVSNTWVVSMANSLFSLFAGFTMFMIIGNLAHKQSVSVDSYDDKIGGYSLAFVTFPVAVNLMKTGLAQFMAVLFFLMLILLGFDSAMNLIEAVLGALDDRSPWFEHHISATVGAICLASFLIDLLMCCQGGSVFMDIIDHFSATYCLLVVGLLECVLIGWTYDLMPEYREDDLHAAKGKAGKGKLPPLLDPNLSAWQKLQAGVLSCRLQREITKVTGQNPQWLPFMFSLMIKFVTPGIIFVLLILNIKDDVSGNYGGYPTWANAAFGWVLCVAIPLIALLVGLFLPDDRGIPLPIDTAPTAAATGRTPRPAAPAAEMGKEVGAV